jgi:hypothetical protein
MHNCTISWACKYFGDSKDAEISRKAKAKSLEKSFFKYVGEEGGGEKEKGRRQHDNEC